MKKRINISVYKNSKRIATYHYKHGHVGDLLAGLRAFYTAVYPSHTINCKVS